MQINTADVRLKVFSAIMCQKQPNLVQHGIESEDDTMINIFAAAAVHGITSPAGKTMLVLVYCCYVVAVNSDVC